MSAAWSDERPSMKAAHVTKWCAVGAVPDEISIGTVPAPAAPVKNEVVIGVKASSINVDDIAVFQDTAGGGWLMHAQTPSANKPHVGGCDYAGVVVQVGPECKTLKVGDRVCGVQDIWMKQRPGTWAERTMCGEDEVCPIDDDMSFVDAAAVAMGAFVCADMFKRAEAALMKTGAERCLVVGASGGLGTVMVQMLSKRKLHVTAVCSGANAEMVRGIGAAEVVDYTVKPFGQQLAAADKFAVVFDFVGGPDTEANAAPLLRRGGQFITAVGPRQNAGDRLLSCGEFTGSACGILRRSMWSALPCAGFRYEMSGSYPPLKPEDFRLVTDTGARSSVALETPFAEAPLREALRRASSHHPGGRVVINFEV